MSNVKSNTCIIALKHGDKVYLGGDRRLMYYFNKITMGEPKVFFKGNMVMGGTGESLAIQILKHMVPVPDRTEGQPDTGYMFDVAYSYKKTIDHYLGEEKKNSEERPFADVLVGLNGNIYLIDSMGSNDILDVDFYAVGCGMDLALGSLKETVKIKSPQTRIRKAIIAASEHSLGVGDGIDIIHI